MDTPSRQSVANALKQHVSGVGLTAVKVRLGNTVEPVPGKGAARLPVAADTALLPRAGRAAGAGKQAF